MKSKWTSVFEAALVSGGLAVAAVGCGGDPAPTDAGCPGCPGPTDAGCPAPGDAGCPGPSDAGCPAPGDAGCPGPTDGGGSSMLPSDPAEFGAFLDAEGFRGAGWVCDSEPQPAASDSPHGSHVICVNDVLAGAPSGSGAYPVGSAAVKETYNMDGTVRGRYIDARLRETAGAAGWYFYAPGGSPAGYGDDASTAGCVGCHSAGGRDFVRRIPSGT